MQAFDQDQLCDEISQEVSENLVQRVSARRPGVVGALPISMDLVKAAVRTALDVAVQYGGSTVEGVVLDNKDAIKEWVSPKVLAFLDGLIHDAQDLKFKTG